MCECDLVLFSFFNDVLMMSLNQPFNLKLNHLVEIYILHLYIHSMQSVLNERLLIFIAKRRHNNCLDYSPQVIKLKKTHTYLHKVSQQVLQVPTKTKP